MFSHGASLACALVVAPTSINWMSTFPNTLKNTFWMFSVLITAIRFEPLMPHVIDAIPELLLCCKAFDIVMLKI